MFENINGNTMKEIFTNKITIKHFTKKEQKRIKKAREFYDRFINQLGKPETDFDNFMYPIKVKEFLNQMDKDIRNDYTNSFDLN